MISYKFEKSINSIHLENLYSDAGWTAYTKDIEKLQRGIDNSLDFITAWDSEKLVGLIRTIGDKETIIYIQDILVLKAYKRHNIGSQLMNMILEKYKDIRQIILLTEDRPESRGFYESLDFESYDKGEGVAFGLKFKI